MKYKLIIFAGTTEGRIIAEYVRNLKIKSLVCVATEYGTNFIKQDKYIDVNQGRLDFVEMKKLFTYNAPKLVIDATHPYAEIVSKNICLCCKDLNIELVRLKREKSNVVKEAIYFENIEKVVKYLSDKQGNILVTTGAKEIHKYKMLDNKRLYVRVLPCDESLLLCEKANILKSHIIAKMGPFSIEENIKDINDNNCKFIVTKDSGNVGGFENKIHAAKKTNVQSLIIKRPCEEGFDIKEVKKIIKDKLNNINIIGIGLGSTDYISVVGQNLIRESNIIIGAKRMVEFAKQLCTDDKKYIEEYKSQVITNIIKNELLINENIKISILMSGDTGFYSGTRNLQKMLEANDIRCNIIPGISSVSYLAAKLGLLWDEFKVLSMHASNEELSHLLYMVQSNEYVFILTSSSKQISIIRDELVKHNLMDVKFYIGENLSYEDECVSEFKIEDLNDNLIDNISNLNVLLLQNNNPVKEGIFFGINDEEFIKEKSPMTKSYIRALCLSRLDIKEDSICFDIGAGSGSCSIEMAKICKRGRVYAIEKKDFACENIKKNIEKFNLHNIEVVHKVAPSYDIYEKPTHAFIGGSSNSIIEIVDDLYNRNKNINICATAISIETAYNLTVIEKKYSQLGYECELINVSISQSKNVAGYSMMIGKNPIYILYIRKR